MLVPSNELRTLCRSDLFRPRDGEISTEAILEGEDLSAETWFLKSSDRHFTSGGEEEVSILFVFVLESNEDSGVWKLPTMFFLDDVGVTKSSSTDSSAMLVLIFVSLSSRM
jgi:hypothetical protein